MTFLSETFEAMNRPLLKLESDPDSPDLLGFTIVTSNAEVGEASGAATAPAGVAGAGDAVCASNTMWSDATRITSIGLRIIIVRPPHPFVIGSILFRSSKSDIKHSPQASTTFYSRPKPHSLGVTSYLSCAFATASLFSCSPPQPP